jgi:hypothetical protein
MEKNIFVGILNAADEKSMIRIRKLVVRISESGFGSGSGSVPNCHGSTTLVGGTPNKISK